jgi:transcriptional regulator with XRE-family HTH domain
MAKDWQEIRRTMSPASRARVDARVRRTLAAMPLAEIRKAIGLTQAELAERMDSTQGGISKVENAADMYLTTLRKYVEALGGDLTLTATFRGGRKIIIDRIGEPEA